MPLPTHISGSRDLVTMRAATRAGFARQALLKVRLADPQIAEARTLAEKLASIQAPNSLTAVGDLRQYLIPSVGLSEKAVSNLSSGDVDSILGQVLPEIVAQSGDDWREELVRRFILTKGDSVGG